MRLQGAEGLQHRTLCFAGGGGVLLSGLGVGDAAHGPAGSTIHSDPASSPQLFRDTSPPKAALPCSPITSLSRAEDASPLRKGSTTSLPSPKGRRTGSTQVRGGTRRRDSTWRKVLWSGQASRR